MRSGTPKFVAVWALRNYVATVALVILLIVKPSLAEENLKQADGSLTIFTVPSAWSKYVGPGLYCDATKLSIRIDHGAAVQWPRKQRVEVRNLALGQPHLVTARCAGKPLQAARFRFSEFKSTQICVSYDVYGGIYLFDFTTRGWGCEKTSRANDLQ